MAHGSIAQKRGFGKRKGGVKEKGKRGKGSPGRPPLNERRSIFSVMERE